MEVTLHEIENDITARILRVILKLFVHDEAGFRHRYFCVNKGFDFQTSVEYTELNNLSNK